MGSQIQKSGEAVKWLDRLAPNLVHVCRFIWNGHRLNTIRPSIPQGGILGGGLGVTNSKVWGSCQTSADSSGNGHRLKQFAPQYPKGHFGGGGYGVTNSSLGKLSYGLTDWHQIW